MCARFFLRPDLDEILRVFELTDAQVDDDVDHGGARWNVAPTQRVPAVYTTPFGDRRLGMFRWGLVPPWWKEARLPTWVNARGETVHSKPAFRAPFKRRRALVPVSGFYEWTEAPRKGAPKQPHAITVGDGLFSLAAIWDVYRGGGDELRSVAIVTQAAVGPVAALHDRQPVVVEADLRDDWLDTKAPVDLLDDVLAPRDPGWATRPVGTGVNDVRHHDGAWMSA